jgi:hypothetical protein
MNSSEEDARNALLAHYSEKSTAQASVLVGLAVVFFASVQAYDVLRKLSLPFGLDTAFLVFSTLSIIFFGVRAIGRLLYYGELAGGILTVEMLGYEETRRMMENDLKRPRSVKYKPTELERLASANQKYLDDLMAMKLSLASRIYAVSHHKWFEYFYLILLSVLALFVFHLWLRSWLFFSF